MGTCVREQIDIKQSSIFTYYYEKLNEIYKNPLIWRHGNYNVHTYAGNFFFAKFYSVVQVRLKITSLMTQSPKGWNDKSVLSYRD